MLKLEVVQFVQVLYRIMSHCQQTRDVGLILFQCWSIILKSDCLHGTCDLLTSRCRTLDSSVGMVFCRAERTPRLMLSTHVCSSCEGQMCSTCPSRKPNLSGCSCMDRLNSQARATISFWFKSVGFESCRLTSVSCNTIIKVGRVRPVHDWDNNKITSNTACLPRVS